MKHTAWALHILGLFMFGLFMFAVPASAEDSTKTEKKEEREVTATGSKHKVESKTESRRGSDTTTDQKTVEDQSHHRSNGMTETERTTTTKHKVESQTKEKGHAGTITNEKTVESASKKRADGLTETQITTTTKLTAPNMKTEKSTTKERTLENSEGKVLEHEKTSR